MVRNSSTLSTDSKIMAVPVKTGASVIELIDQLLTDYTRLEDIIGENGLLKQLTKAVLERAP